MIDLPHLVLAHDPSDELTIQDVPDERGATVLCQALVHRVQIHGQDVLVSIRRQALDEPVPHFPVRSRDQDNRLPHRTASFLVGPRPARPRMSCKLRVF